MIEGQGSGKHSLARFEMKQVIVVGKKAIVGSRESRILKRQRGAGGIVPGRVGTCVLI